MKMLTIQWKYWPLHWIPYLQGVIEIPFLDLNEGKRELPKKQLNEYLFGPAIGGVVCLNLLDSLVPASRVLELAPDGWNVEIRQWLLVWSDLSILVEVELTDLGDVCVSQNSCVLSQENGM